jgi:NodT family efflux transporter outer membrane factor (OMF) lipoprotein
MMRLRALAIAMAASLAGCSFAPTYEPPKTDVADTFKESGPWQTAAPSDQLERGDWWRDYGDETLDDLQMRLDANNPNLAAAADRYAQSRAYLAQTRGALLPQIDSNGLSTHNRQSDNRPLRSASQPDEYIDNNVGAQLSYELDLWGRVRNLVAAGRASTEAASADLASTRLSLHAELANDYIVLRGYDAQEKLFADTVAAYEQALTLTQNRFEGGASSGLDVARAQTQLENARAQRSEIHAQRALYEHAIASLVGESASRFSLEPKVVDLPLPKIPVALPSTLLERRPDIASAERRASAANSMIGVARAAFFPSISLTASGGYENTGEAGWLTSPNSYWSVGPRFSFALFDTGKRRAIEAQARAAFDEASDRYRSTTLAAFQQVEDELALLHLLGDEAREQGLAVDAAQRTLHLSMDRYQNGAINYLDVVESQTAALQAQRNALVLHDRLLRASVDLVRAIGGGWTDTQMTTATMKTASNSPSQTTP